MRAVEWLTGMGLGHTIIARQKEDCYLRWGGGGEHVIFVILFWTAGKLTFVHQLFLEFSLKCSDPCYLMWLTETTWKGMCESGDSVWTDYVESEPININISDIDLILWVLLGVRVLRVFWDTVLCLLFSVPLVINTHTYYLIFLSNKSIFGWEMKMLEATILVYYIVILFVVNVLEAYILVINSCKWKALHSCYKLQKKEDGVKKKWIKLSHVFV